MLIQEVQGCDKHVTRLLISDNLVRTTLSSPIRYCRAILQVLKSCGTGEMQGALSCFVNALLLSLKLKG